MSFYSKISLFALLAAGSIMGMEQPPRLKAPASSAAAQAINQSMIKVFSDTQQIDAIQRNYLEASETLKNMLHDVDSEHALVLPESMIEDYVAIKDLLLYEYRFNIETTDEKTVTEILKPKTEQQLVAIANACQRFDLNKLSECTITVVAEKLNTQAKKEECLRNGSYNLNWTPDVAHLIAQEMILQSYLWQLYHRFAAYVGIKHCAFACEGTERKRSPDFSPSYTLNNRELDFTLYTGWGWDKVALPNENDYLDDYFTPTDKDILRIKHKLIQADEPNIHGNQIVWKLNGQCIKLFEIDNPRELANRYSTLTPEQVTLLGYCFIKTYNKQPYELEKYPGITKICKKSLPRELAYFVPNWWQRRSWLSKAAIITGAAAATGLAAWLGYKYISKK